MTNMTLKSKESWQDKLYLSKPLIGNKKGGILCTI
jgi:hypothetical protein